MKTETLRKKDKKDLVTDLEAKQKELAEIRFDLKIGKEKDASRVKKLKKDVARLLTIINEVKVMKIEDKSDKIDDSLKDSLKK